VDEAGTAGDDGVPTQAVLIMYKEEELLRTWGKKWPLLLILSMNKRDVHEHLLPLT